MWESDDSVVGKSFIQGRSPLSIKEILHTTDGILDTPMSIVTDEEIKAERIAGREEILKLACETICLMCREGNPVLFDQPDGPYMHSYMESGGEIHYACEARKLLAEYASQFLPPPVEERKVMYNGEWAIKNFQYANQQSRYCRGDR